MPLTLTPEGGATGTITSTPALAVSATAMLVPPIGCERLKARLRAALIALGGPGSKASVPLRPPGTDSDSEGLPAKVGIACAMKPAAGLSDGAVNDRSSMLPTKSETMPTAACALVTSAAETAPNSAATLSASCFTGGLACASPLSISSILPIENALG